MKKLERGITFMKRIVCFGAIGICITFLFNGCVGGCSNEKSEEEIKIDLNVSGEEELNQLEGLQKQVKEQPDKLAELQGELSTKKTGKANKTEITKLKQEI